ncbi:enoyl-CoA hydratase [Jannaschia sp. EhC01]|nr:enoyl-CoA hydratase [Jannaschia sp. EhC01]
MSEITVTEPDARGLVTVQLTRPDARNALNLAMCMALQRAFATIAQTPDARAVLVAAEGPVFCAGADLKERKGKDAAWVVTRRRASFDAYAAIEACPIPVVAALDGPVIGSGGEIAMACDFALASSNVHFRWPEIGWGAVGATQRLQRRIGLSRAKELLFTGRKMDVQEALSTGLVARTADNLSALVAQVLDPILAAPPNSMRLGKQAMNDGSKTDLAGGIEIEMQAIESSLQGQEWQDGLAAFSKRTSSDTQ